MVALVAFDPAKSLKNQVASLYGNSGVCVLGNEQQVIENIGGGSGVYSGAPPGQKVVALVASPYRGRPCATKTDTKIPTIEGAINVGRASLYEIGQIVDYVDLVDFSRERPAEPILSETAKWFCLMTNPNCQGRAALGLYAAGYRTFLPKIRKWVSHARVRKAKEVPLLGRYLFVEVDQPRQNFGAVRAVNGVETLISTLGVPTVFPSHWVDDLRLRYMAGEWDEVAKGPLPVGARIKIVEGEFNEMLATVTKRKGRLIDFKLLDKNQYGRMNECSVRAA